MFLFSGRNGPPRIQAPLELSRATASTNRRHLGMLPLFIHTSTCFRILIITKSIQHLPYHRIDASENVTAVTSSEPPSLASSGLHPLINNDCDSRISRGPSLPAPRASRNYSSIPLSKGPSSITTSLAELPPHGARELPATEGAILRSRLEPRRQTVRCIRLQ